MTSRRSRFGLRVALALLMVAGALAILRPWTVVPIQSAGPRTFDAQAYVAGIWDTRVRPTAAAGAVDVQTFLQTSATTASSGVAARAVFVKGSATIAGIDRHSRVGLARLTPASPKGTRDAAIQVGPVFRGTAIRDALPFIQFTDFVNQLEFAAVANALNDRAAALIASVGDLDALVGKDVTFLGATPSTAATATVEITPLEFQIARSAPTSAGSRGAR